MKLALLALLLVAPAQTEDEAGRAAAAQLLDEGNQAFRAGRITEALERFERAREAFSSPKIHLNIAEAHRALGNAAQAVLHYEAFLYEADAPAPAVVTQVEARVEELEPRIARLSLDAPYGAQVSLDDAEWAAPWTRRPVTVGTHRVAVRAPGHLPWGQAVTVEAGQHLALEPNLAPEVIAQSTPPEAEGGPSDLLWLWVGLGALAVVAAGAVVISTTGGDDFVPMGELGRSRTSEWQSR